MRTCCVSDKNVCEGISYIRFCFYFIGNTVIHSCVKVELSYEIKTLRGCAARGKENIACEPLARGESRKQDSFYYGSVMEINERTG